MKNTPFSRIAFLALALGTASIPTAFAQTTTTPAPSAPAAPAALPPAAGGKHDREAALTADERAHLEKVRTEVLAANPDLKTEGDSLKAQHQALKAQGASASAADKAALKASAKEHEEKMAIAMLKIDPTVEPILAKLKAAHKAQKAAAGAA